MVYTESAPRRQLFHAAPAMAALKYTTSADKKKKAKNKKKRYSYQKLVTHVESHASAVSLLALAENSSFGELDRALLQVSIACCPDTAFLTLLRPADEKVGCGVDKLLRTGGVPTSLTSIVLAVADGLFWSLLVRD